MTAIEMNKQRNKDMYKTANITRGLNGNMNIQRHFDKGIISASKTEQEK